MRIRFFLTAVALAGSVQATETATPEQGEPMAWRYGLLRTAQSVHDEQAAARAPGSVMRFRLPKVDPAQGDNQVEIVQKDKRIPLPMTSATTFALPPGLNAAKGDPVVVVNKHFPKGDFNHPNVLVRSPDLPPGVARMGDLRLACAAQVAMGKAESLKFRALFATVGLFGFDVCEDMEVTTIEAPAGVYDTIVIEDGERRLVQSKAGGKPPRLGDPAWSDNARISYLANEQVVQ